ncbi:MAG: 50S ribosomal protein L25 [Nannocystaceae bacterium]
MSHEARTMNALIRKDTGKGVARSLRRDGRLPGVLYGRGGDRLSLSLDLQELEKAIDPARKWNTWFSVRVQEEGKAERVESVMVVDRQIHPVRRDIIHVDFLRVDPSAEIETQVPVEYVGRPIGVQAGGKLKTFRRYIKIASIPGNIPVKIDIDISNLDGNQTMRISDLTVEGFRLREKPTDPLAFVEAAKAKVEEKVDDKKAKKGKK